MQNDDEIWMPVEGYEDHYEVSSLGNVRSLDREVLCRAGATRIHRGKVLKPVLTRSERGNSYFVVALSQENIATLHSVSRLVAQHFVPNPFALPRVKHKDFNMANNRADNLEWVTVTDIAVAFDHTLRLGNGRYAKRAKTPASLTVWQDAKTSKGI